MKTYPFKITVATILFAAGITITSCGDNKAAAKDNTATAEVAETDEKDDKALQDKMNPYVDAINTVSKPINKGYSYYLKYVDAETGEQLNKNGSVYFLSEIQNLDGKLAAIEKASQTAPKADIDQYATPYVTKAKAALELHNQLAAYYNAKEDLMDKRAKGIALHKDYVTVLTDFKTTALQVSDAYDKYYKDGNAKYLAKLEKKGDVMRIAANHLMNEAEVLKDNFYAAFPEKGDVKFTPEFETVMTQTSKFQTLLSTYNTTQQGLSEQDKKRFFRAGTSFSSFASSAENLLIYIRTAIDKIKNGSDPNSYDSQYKGVSEQYGNMIDEFNRNQF